MSSTRPAPVRARGSVDTGDESITPASQRTVRSRKRPPEKQRGGTIGRYFSLFDLPWTKYRVDVLQRLGECMARSERPDSTVIPSGYVYLGQLIAHDVTRLARPSKESVGATELIQRATPALDLGNIYGTGLKDKRVAISKDGKMLLGRTVDRKGRPSSYDDLPRNRRRRARIADDRDDENLLLAQLHLQFLKLHNVLMDHVRFDHPDWDTQRLFGYVREQMILNYQEVVLYDFLDAVIDPRVWERVICNGRTCLWNPVRAEEPRIPVEFSTAAFRFMHSMIRRDYALTRFQAADVPTLFQMTGSGGFGGNASLPDTHVVSWQLFFNDHQQPVPRHLNLALHIDPLIHVRLRPNDEVLATKDLIAGDRSRLPNAQALVRHIETAHPQCASAIDLRLLSADEINAPMRSADGSTIRLLDQLGEDFGLQNKTPLFYYILAEAQAVHGGRRLGPLGSLLVAEVLRGLVSLSRPSIMRKGLTRRYILPTKNVHGDYFLTMSDLLRKIPA